MALKNSNLHKAKKAKNDEFYTRYEDIEKEVSHYWPELNGKWIYSSCDDYRSSEFKNYFVSNFSSLGLAHYTCTNYDIGEGAWRYDYDGSAETITQLEGTGDFRSPECIEFLKEADVVVTNPPFSLFREYVKQLMDYGKKFIIIGNQAQILTKDIFPYVKNNQLWYGVSMNGANRWFYVPDTYEFWDKAAGAKIENGKKMLFVNGVVWFTNISNEKRNTKLDLFRRYSNDYPKYDNYDAIEVGRVENIPADYDGVMGVPITFLHKYNPEQFEIIGIFNNYNPETANKECGQYYGEAVPVTSTKSLFRGPVINGKAIYTRMLIRKRNA